MTYSAYLVFAKNLREYYPAANNDIPLAVNQLRDHLGQKYYGDRYCTTCGTVRKDRYVINDGSAIIRPHKLSDPDIRFFQYTNPHHMRGYGLLTIAPVNWKNVLAMIRKAINKHKTARRRRIGHRLQPLRHRIAQVANRAML